MKMLFKEEQRMANWIKYLVLFQMLITALIVGASWLANNDEFESRSDLIALSIVFVLMIGAIWLIYSIKMTTEVHKDFIRLKYFPFRNRWKTVSFDEVDSFEVKRGKLISEFGGWGYGKGFGNKRSYTTKGDYGLLLQLYNGKTVFIGTQKPKRLEQALRNTQLNGER